MALATSLSVFCFLANWLLISSPRRFSSDIGSIRVSPKKKKNIYINIFIIVYINTINPFECVCACVDNN